MPGAPWAPVDASVPFPPGMAGVTFHSPGTLTDLPPILFLLTGGVPKPSTLLLTPWVTDHSALTSSASDLCTCPFAGACSLAHLSGDLWMGFCAALGVPAGEIQPVLQVKLAPR